MDATTLRGLIAGRIAAAGLTPHAAARLAGLPEATVRLYLSGGSDTTTDRALRLAAAVGLAVTARPDQGFRPPPPARPGRPKKIPQNPED